MSLLTPFFERLYRYGHAINSHDVLKAIAVLLMVVDHIGAYLLNDNPWCRLIGRGAAPLFFFLIGYVNKLHIRMSLIVYGLILSMIGYYFYGGFWISILLNFIFIEWLFWFIPPEKVNTLGRGLVFIIALALNSVVYQYLEYGFFGLLIAASGRFIAVKDPQADIWLLLTLVAYFVGESMTFHFMRNNYLLFAFGSLVVALFQLRFYRLRTFASPHWVAVPCLVLSRFSLPIYFYHLLGLEIYYVISHKLW